MNVRQFHGITSLGLVAVAVIIAAVAIFRVSWQWGILYSLVIIATPIAILYAFCAKCPCRHHCGHILPGKAAKLFNRQAGDYTLTELIVVGISLLLLMGVPQFWLWLYPGWFIIFWMLNLTALTQIRGVICKHCDNIYCPVNNRTM
jgi:hypothetical protein